MNVHNLRWLRYSSSNSVEGRALHRFCMEYGFDQYVKQPTRDQHLLDLVLSDMGEALSSRVVAPIADHNGVLTKFHFSLETFGCNPRPVWNFRSADWDGLFDFLNSANFGFIEFDNVHTATQKFTDLILASAAQFISRREIPVEKSVHPWMTERCRILVQKKHAAVGTEEYGIACQKCSEALQEEFKVYVLNIKHRLGTLPHGSKEFWKISKKLMLGADKRIAIPVLKYDGLEDDGMTTHWAKTPFEKASLFSSTFRQKWVLPAAQHNFYTNTYFARHTPRGGMLQLRSRDALYHLAHLDPTSATGPDGLSTILLRKIAPAICFAFARLARRIAECGVWPNIWKMHWLCPLFKKGSRSSPQNYRALPITSHLSKVMERFLGMHFLNHLSFGGALVFVNLLTENIMVRGTLFFMLSWFGCLLLLTGRRLEFTAVMSLLRLIVFLFPS